MAIPVDPKDRLLDVVCPQRHIVSIVASGEPLPVLYSYARGTRPIPGHVIAADHFAGLVSTDGINYFPLRGGSSVTSLTVMCPRCRAVYVLEHADCLAGIATPPVKGRTPRITLQRVVSAKSH
jgi:hypothetical protein